MTTITLGRKPTLGEVLDYYTREDFLSFMLALRRRYRVAAVISRTLHWEPDWARDEVCGAPVEDLRRWIVEKIAQAMPNVGANERPAYYPSFHQSVRLRSAGGEGDCFDCIFEADLPTWRDSFRDVGAIVSLMAQFGVRYRHKFSGHRSLHIVIPAESLPRGYRGKKVMQVALQLLHWSHAQAHTLPQITRMPFSLNEDTGLVCLPIARGALAQFRPWQANLHWVEVNDPDWTTPIPDAETADAQAALAAFLAAIKERPAEINTTYFIPDTAAILAGHRAAMNARRGDPIVAEGAWAQLSADGVLPEPALLDGLSASEPDARWLAIEAYLLRGAELSPDGVHALLGEREEYTRVAAMDVLLRCEDALAPVLASMLGTGRAYSTAGAQAAYLLTQSETLRTQMLGALYADENRSRDATLIAACLLGALARDWDGAFRLLAPLEAATDLTGRQRVQLQALRQMREMGTWDRRKGALQAQELAALGPDITDLLLLAVTSASRELRRDIVAALSELADPRAVDLLVVALSDSYSRVRRKAVGALMRIGVPAVEALIAALASDQSLTRQNAARCLGYIGAELGIADRVKPAIVPLLDDGDAEVRRHAAGALAELATSGDLDHLVKVVREATSWRAGKQAVETLIAAGEAGQAALLRLALDEHAVVAAYAIATQGDARGSDILAAFLDDADSARREAAMELLAELHDPRCAPYLAEQVQMLAHWKAMEYAQRLGEIGTPEAVDALIAALASEHMLTRRGAVRGLGAAKDPRAIPALIRALNDADGKTRGEAAKALEAIGPAVSAPLRESLSDDSQAGRQRRNYIRQILKTIH